MLLALLGIPVVQASGEAEATCADLNARGVNYQFITLWYLVLYI